jgi:hypothetical protein
MAPAVWQEIPPILSDIHAVFTRECVRQSGYVSHFLSVNRMQGQAAYEDYVRVWRVFQVSGVILPSCRDTGQRLAFTCALYIIVFIVLAIPILSVTVPPLVDYPNHLARMHILAHYADSAALQSNYAVSWKLSPYIAMDLIVPVLVKLTSIYTAGRIFLCICLFLFVLGTAAVHAALFRRFSPWPAASALSAYSLMFSYGFLNYLFGVDVWLFAFAGWIVLSRRSDGWRIIGGSVLSLAVFFCHFFAFFGYMLCIGAYELGVWLSADHRSFSTLCRRAAVAFCPFILPLVIFAVASEGQEGGATAFATLRWWVTAMLSPVVFLSSPFNFTLLAVLLIIPLRRGLLGKVRLASEMRVPLVIVGVAVLAMPHLMFGVFWGADYRLPLVFVALFIAGFSWREVPMRVSAALACFLIVLLTANIAIITWSWRPIAAQFDEFRAAMRVIPEGARIIAFYDEDGISLSMKHRPEPLYDHLPALAIIERDAYLPYLFKHPMMPVKGSPARRATDTPVGQPITLSALIEGADPAHGAQFLGTPVTMGIHNYWGGWPDHYDYAIEFSFGARPALPKQLDLVKSGTFFNIYRIQNDHG